MRVVESLDDAPLQLSQADVVVVGSGLFGVTIAEHIARFEGKTVLVLERRPHFGGNVFSYSDEHTGIEVHKYGPHIFHTSNEEVMAYVQRFTDLNNYSHRVYAVHAGVPFSLPINLHTLSQFHGRSISPGEAKELIAGEKDPKAASFEDAAISAIGDDLYRAFFAGYTQKQWQESPKDLPASIFSRLPIRFDYNTRYFNDTYEGIPKDGYTEWVRRMLDHDNIMVALNADFREVRPHIDPGTLVVYSGPIDEYFGYQFGRLTWRTLDFQHEVLNVESFQGVAQMNYPGLDVPWTRIIEHKYFHPDAPSIESTVITREFSRLAGEGDEPYYPVRTRIESNRYAKYRELASKERNTIFGGRLGSFAYFDMHQAISAAMKTFSSKIAGRL